MPPEAVAGLLASGRREEAGQTAPARGLYLVDVRYDLAQFPELKALAPPEGAWP